MLFCHRKINNASTIPLKKKQKGKKNGKLYAENPTKNAQIVAHEHVYNFFFRRYRRNQSVDEMVLKYLRILSLFVLLFLCLCYRP